MRDVFIVLGFIYLLILNASVAISSTDRVLLVLVPALLLLFLALGFRRSPRKPFDGWFFAKLALSIACLMYALLPRVQ